MELHTQSRTERLEFWRAMGRAAARSAWADGLSKEDIAKEEDNAAREGFRGAFISAFKSENVVLFNRNRVR